MHREDAKIVIPTTLKHKLIFLSLFVILCIPEALYHEYTLGMINIGAYPVHLSDILSTILIIIALSKILITGRIARSSYYSPLILLIIVILLQGLRAWGVYPVREIIKDGRPILQWLVILAIPQLFEDIEEKKYWIRAGIILCILPPLITVVGVLIAFFLIPNIGILIAQPLMYGRTIFTCFFNSVFVSIAFFGCYKLIYPEKRGYGALATVLFILPLLIFVVSQSRFVILMWLVLLFEFLVFSIFKLRVARTMFIFIAIAIVAVILVFFVMPVQWQGAATRIADYANIESLTYGHDLPRIQKMEMVFNDFLDNILIGTGVGKPYYHIISSEMLASPADSFIIEAGAALGIFGLAAIIWLFIILFRQLIRLTKREYYDNEKYMKAFVYALILGLPIIIIEMIVGNSIWLHRTFPLQFAVYVSTVDMLSNAKCNGVVQS